MPYSLGFVFVLALVASTLSVSAQDEGATSKPSEEDAPPSSESASEEPSLQLKLDDAGVGVVPPPPRRPDGYTLGEMEVRLKRAKIGLGVSVGVAGAGVAILMVASLVALGQWGKDEPFDRAETAILTGGVLLSAGVVGIATAGGILAHRKRKLRRLREDHYHRTREAVEVDTSDDAFLVIVTRKYEGGQLMGASVFIRHTDSGRDASPYVDAVEIDTLEHVIREHKAKLLSGE